MATMSEAVKYVGVWHQVLTDLKSALSTAGPDFAAVCGEAVAYSSGQAADFGAGTAGRQATGDAMRRVSLALDLVTQATTQVAKLDELLKEAAAGVAEADGRQAAERRRLSI